MGESRRGLLLSYLALSMVLVGAWAYALPSSAAIPQRAQLIHAVPDAAGGVGDRGILPGPVQPRELPDQRSARASVDSGADGDALASSGTCRIDPVGSRSFFLFDGSGCVASALRLAHRPRDPPRSI